jgi:FAD:protein FMN transferase
MGPIHRAATRILVIASAVAGLAACEPRERDEKTKSYTGRTMGMTYQVTVAGVRNDDDGLRIERCVTDVLADVTARLSTYSATSEISALNRNGSTDWIGVSAPLIAVIAAGQRVSVETHGAFDLTVAPLVRLWGVGAGAPAAAAEASEAPSMEFVHDATANVGYSWLEIRSGPDPAVRKGKVPLELDVDAIAPGHAVDRMSRCIGGAGFANHLVRIGGEVRAAGRRADGGPWRIGVESPVRATREAYTIVELDDLAVSTTGRDSGSRALPGGRRLPRTIDPRTGEPVRHGLVSVTVVHPRATLADAYSTALMVLGPEEGYAVAERLGLPALFLEGVGQSDAVRERSTEAFEQLRRPVQPASL